MITIEFNHDGWLRRVEVFDWCEEVFGPYDYSGSGVWKFYSDYESNPDIMPRRMILELYDENFASMFLLRWGELKFTFVG